MYLFLHSLPGHNFGNVCMPLLKAIGWLFCSFDFHWSSNAVSSPGPSGPGAVAASHCCCLPGTSLFLVLDTECWTLYPCFFSKLSSINLLLCPAFPTSTLTDRGGCHQMHTLTLRVTSGVQWCQALSFCGGGPAQHNR